MGQLVLLVVAAAWAAVLVPPLLRSRMENRPNSSVSDFRNQLSSLQRAMPSRGVAMRSMARPLAPSPLSRPAASGRPGLSAHSRSHGGQPVRLAAGPPADRRRRAEPVRTYDASPRVRSHAERVARPVSSREVLKRRRANVLFGDLPNELQSIMRAFQSNDAQEARKAFFEKRTPVFEGR